MVHYYSNKIILELLFIFVVTSCVISVEMEDDVIVASNRDFEQIIRSHKYVFFYAYAPDCSVCQRVLPIYGAIATAAKEANFNVTFVKANAATNNHIYQLINIYEFPAIRFFIDGEILEFKFETQDHQEEIMRWLEKLFKSQSLIKEANPLSTLEEVEKYIKYQKFGMLYIGNNATSLELVKDACRAFQGLSCRVSNITTENTQFTDDSLHLFITDIHLVYSFKTNSSSEEEKSILQPKLRELIFQMAYNKDFHKNGLNCGSDLSNFLHWHRLPFMVGFGGSRHVTMEKLLNNARNKLGQKLPVCRVEDLKDDIGSLIALEVGVNKNMIPSIFILEFGFQYKDTKRYRFHQINSKKDENELQTQFEHFYQSFLNKTLVPIQKSEDIPPTNVNKKSKVVKLVGHNFQQVMTVPKDVLILFYRGSLDESLKNDYEELAEDLSATQEFIVAWIDEHMNEAAKPYGSDAGPIIKLFGKNFKNRPFVFNKGMNYDEITAFVKKNSKIANDILSLKRDDL